MTHPEFSGTYKLENELYIYQYSGTLPIIYNDLKLINKDLFASFSKLMLQKEYGLVHTFRKGSPISLAPAKEEEMVFIYDDHFGTIIINKQDIPYILGYHDWPTEFEL